MRMQNPLHPGEVLRELCLEPLGLNVTAAAKGLGVSRKTLSAILNGRAGISPEMAVRLSIAFGTTSESWLNHQVQYDLWQAPLAVSRKAATSNDTREESGRRPRPSYSTPAIGAPLGGRQWRLGAACV